MSETKPDFPGFRACMKMMRKHNPQIQEDGFHFLLPYASDFVSELLNEFHHETSHGIKLWILELLGEARSPQTLSLFSEHLRHADESYRTWAAYGLHKLNTKETRRILWEARSYTFPTREETERFRTMLDEVQQRK